MYHRAIASHAERDRRERIAERVFRWAVFVETQISFVRTLKGAEATFEKGVLTISLPKTAEAQARKRIPIRAG